jgi:molybdopterin-guanine dinucleotide biosynthesis protein A
VSVRDVCVVILAGGTASRFGGVMQVLPKCFLPVSSEETLLTRLLSQLQEAGFAKTVISTSPQWFPLFEAFTRRCRETRSTDALEREDRPQKTMVCPTVLSNPAHAAGPLAALGNAARQIEEPRLLLCLPDIFFWENPFPELAAGDRAAALSGCPVDRLTKSPSSGFLTVKDGVVETLAYQPPPARPDAFWPGVALFRQSGVVPLLESIAPEGPIENLFSAAIAQGVRFTFQPCGPFGNVNTMGEWLFLLERPTQMTP